MDINELYGLIFKSSMSELEVWLVYREDRYETVMGDGFFIYLDRAFLTHDDAEKFARSERDQSLLKSKEYGHHYYLYRALLFLEPRNYDPQIKFSEFITAFDDAYRQNEIAPAIDEIARAIIRA